MMPRWSWVVFEDLEGVPDVVGCDYCGCEIGDDGQPFFQPDSRFVDLDELEEIREILDMSEDDFYCASLCETCRDMVEEELASRSE